MYKDQQGHKELRECQGLKALRAYGVSKAQREAKAYKDRLAYKGRLGPKAFKDL